MLEVKNVSKSFGGLNALQNVSFHVNEGEIVSLIGPNGAGKTTVMNVITGFETPTNGTVTFKKQEIVNKQPHELNVLGMSRTFQIARLFKQMSVLENVMIGSFANLKTNHWKGLLQSRAARKELKEAREKAYEFLKFVGMEKIADTPAAILPYGQIRLVEVARALNGNPQLLLLDEPACGLNSSEVNDFIDILQRIKEMGITILLIEHDMSLVMTVSDRLVVLNNGQLLTSGTTTEVKNNPEVISAYLGKGFEHAQAE